MLPPYLFTSSKLEGTEGPIGRLMSYILTSIDHAHHSADLIETTPRRGELSFGST